MHLTGSAECRQDLCCSTEKSEFVAQYDVDNWSSEDFIEGKHFTALKKTDLYLFSPDELNDGSMKNRTGHCSSIG